MKRPEHKRQSPWQRGKTPGKEWSEQAWQEKMAPMVQESLVATAKVAAEKKKAKKKNKGKKRAEWMARQIAAFAHFGKVKEEEQEGAPSSSSGGGGTYQEPDFGVHQAFFKESLKKYDEAFKPVLYLQTFRSMLWEVLSAAS